MGQTRISIRTLPSGERVRHYPPSEGFPEGRTVLINTGRSLIDKLEEDWESKEEALRDLRVISRQKVEVKKQADAADPAVPPEKRFL